MFYDVILLLIGAFIIVKLSFLSLLIGFALKITLILKQPLKLLNSFLDIFTTVNFICLQDTRHCFLVYL